LAQEPQRKAAANKTRTTYKQTLHQ
jgi:hypothetical protein